MLPTEFAYWLKGVLLNKSYLSKAELELIKENLNKVKLSPVWGLSGANDISVKTGEEDKDLDYFKN